MPRLLSAALLATTMLAGPAVAAPSVVASIKPIHSLVAAVMAGVDEPALLVRGGASPHTYTLRPSDAAALEAADVVFWTGHGLELFLADALDTLAGGAVVVELAETEGLTLLPLREGGSFEAHAHGDHGHDHDHDDDDGHDHDHDHDHDDHDHDDHDEHDHDHAHDGDHGHAHAPGEADMHFWLDPQNAKLLVAAIAGTLSAVDPDNAAAYAANAEAEITALDALTAEVAALLAPVQDRPFIVFHDAYQYFEARFGLAAAGSITVSPEVMPGVQRIGELRARVSELEAACVFAEPQFEPAIVGAIIEGTPARAGVLDPEGGLLTEGPGLYAELVRGLATSLVECLD